MNLRIAKKILKKKDSLKYRKHQITKAETLLGRAQRNAEKAASKKAKAESEAEVPATPEPVEATSPAETTEETSEGQES